MLDTRDTEDGSKSSPFEGFPFELIFTILLFLGPKQLLPCFLVSKTFRSVVSNDSFWANKYLEYFSDHYSAARENIAVDPRQTWFKTFFTSRQNKKQEHEFFMNKLALLIKKKKVSALKERGLTLENLRKYNRESKSLLYWVWQANDPGTLNYIFELAKERFKKKSSFHLPWRESSEVDTLDVDQKDGNDDDIIFWAFASKREYAFIKALMAKSKRHWPTTISLAIMSGSLDLLETLWKEYPDSRPQDLSYALELAVMYNHVDMVAYLFQLGANLSLKRFASDGRHPIHSAIINQSLEMLKILMSHVSEEEKSAILAVKDRCNRTPFYFACKYYTPEIVDYLIKENVDPSIEDKFGETPLRWAASQGLINPIVYIIDKQASLDVAIKRRRGEVHGITPLHIAAEKGHFKVVQLLVKAGAKIDLRSKNGLLAIHLAAKNGFTSIVEYLVEKSALSLVNVSDESGYTPLLFATENGQKETVAYLLQVGADVNVRTQYDGTTPLTSAVRGKYHEIVDLLMQHHSKTDLLLPNLEKNPTIQAGKEALWRAAINGGFLQIVKMLVETQADLLDVNFDDINDHVLDAAIRINQPEITAYLVQQIDATKRPRPRGTLDFAAYLGRNEIVKILLKNDFTPVLDEKIEYKKLNKETQLQMHLVAMIEKTKRNLEKQKKELENMPAPSELDNQPQAKKKFTIYKGPVFKELTFSWGASKTVPRDDIEAKRNIKQEKLLKAEFLKKVMIKGQKDDGDASLLEFFVEDNEKKDALDTIYEAWSNLKP